MTPLEPEPDDEVLITLEMVGGGLLGVSLVLLGIAAALRRWRYVALSS